MRRRVTVDILSLGRRIFGRKLGNLEVSRSIIRKDYRDFDLMIRLISIFWIDPS